MKLNVFSRALVVIGILFLGSASTAGAIDVIDTSCGSGGDMSGQSKVCSAKKEDAKPVVANVISTLMYLLGALSVIMIVVGGIKYATSNGDSNNIQSAKNTIMYAVIGLIVAILAQAIVSFVASSLK